MRCTPPHPPVVPELICLAQGMTPHGLSCSTYRALVGLAMTTHPVRSHFGRSANVVAVSERAFFFHRADERTIGPPWLSNPLTRINKLEKGRSRVQKHSSHSFCFNARFFFPLFFLHSRSAWEIIWAVTSLTLAFITVYPRKTWFRKQLSLENIQ